MEVKFPLIHALFEDSKLILLALVYSGAATGGGPKAGTTGLVGLSMSISDSELLPDVTEVSVLGGPPGGSPAFLVFFFFSVPAFDPFVEAGVAGSESSFPA